ncbi:type III PLP-dependent enzyme [Kistimonas scapharcae]|uniref:ornithine decarboxylase n=1 Tax=Kistimonas scapharcae TaxID=1036133 RepID=A0ABP8V462_9GAMM
MNTITIAQASAATQWQSLVTDFGSPLMVIDCAKVLQQYQQLCEALPGVQHYFAIKALPHLSVLKTLAQAGAGFDLASSGEIDLLRQMAVSPRHTIYTHPIKRDIDIRSALRFGCTTFVVDSPQEMEKFLPYRQRVALLLRLSFPNPSSPINLSRKFGCSPEQVPLLLKLSQRMGMTVKGLSFHAGSQCPNPDNHVRAILTCAGLINDSLQYLNGRGLGVLNIGGGFPVPYIDEVPSIHTFCSKIRTALTALPAHVQVISEPGRYIAAPAATSVSSIMGIAHRQGRCWYYLDDGLYGSFSGQLYDYRRYPLTVFSDQHEREHAVLSGPTCDSIDVIAEDIRLPRLSMGDLVIGHQMGAYTIASATDFNLFPRARDVVINPPDETGMNLSL